MYYVVYENVQILSNPNYLSVQINYLTKYSFQQFVPILIIRF